MVCGEKLNYESQSKSLECYFCKETKPASISCISGHFVCDTCHGKDALSAITELAYSTSSASPGEIAEQMMSHPSVAMIGGEHHAIVAVSVLAALKNSESLHYVNRNISVNDDLIERAIDRTWTSKLPSCMCANYGACGAALASGAVFSLLMDATCDLPKKRERQIAMEVTNHVASEIAWFRGTCCKLSTRLAIDGVSLAIKEHFGLELPREKVECQHAKRNPYKCLGTICPYSRVQTQTES